MKLNPNVYSMVGKKFFLYINGTNMPKGIIIIIFRKSSLVAPPCPSRKSLNGIKFIFADDILRLIKGIGITNGIKVKYKVKQI
nr:hypothetical protein [Anaerocolumna jejuensis]